MISILFDTVFSKSKKFKYIITITSYPFEFDQINLMGHQKKKGAHKILKFRLITSSRERQRVFLHDFNFLCMSADLS